MKIQLSVIIVNYNTVSVLKKCLKSIIEFTNNLQFEIIVVDNNSSDREIENLPILFKDVKFYFLDSNNGFGSGCNYGSMKATGEYLLFINPDVIIFNNVLFELYKNALKYSEMGIGAPLLFNSENSYQCTTGFKMGLIYELFEAFFIIILYRKVFYLLKIKNYKQTQPIRVGWVSGAFMIIKRDIFDHVNGFDKHFFLNYEDIDLSKRIEETGLYIYYFPFLKSMHAGLAIQGKNYEYLVLNRYKSRLIYARKHYKLFSKLIVRLIHIIGLVLRILVLKLKCKNVENKQRLSGYVKSLNIYIK